MAFDDLDAWRAWLAAHHASSRGVWLISNRKASGLPRIEEDDAICEALCFGWIDSLPRRLDDTRSMLLFTPRKPRSAWSKINKARVDRMIEAGRMRAAGLAKVEAAKATGLWEKLDGVERLETPADLAAAFARHPGAAAHFEAFPRSAKRGILEWILNAKGIETRAKRIEETARLAAENMRANQWRGPKP
jgi:uncharacterized protein YdeI (YjbR/CyaY-like superfamily)